MKEELNQIFKILDESKLFNICLYDLMETNPFYNYVFISTALNKRQLTASLNHLDEASINYHHVEGRDSDWILVDMGDILINIMTSESRELYSLDNLFISYKKLI